MIRVRVPGSSANLGPGFDAFAAALALHLELEVTETGSFSFGTDLHVARDRRNLAVRAFARLHPPDRFAFRMRSVIPLSGGLGSSGAACAAGLSAILVVPRIPVRTAAARAALPATVPLADAAANAGHAALLLLGLERGDLDLVAAGLCDRIHQPYRAHLFPQSAALL